LNYSALPRNAFNRDRCVTGIAPSAIHGAPDRQQLLPHRPVRNKPHALRLYDQRLDGPSARHLEKPRLELNVLRPVDPDARPSFPMGNRVTRKPDRLSSGVADLAGFVVEEAVPAVRRHKQEKP
jgi:hypothetical protein